MKHNYVVNVGNIGNIECSSKKSAMVTYLEYVVDSKDCVGRGAQENVVILIDGEPDARHEFIWLTWRIEVQKADVIQKRTEFEKALIIFNRFLENADNEYS